MSARRTLAPPRGYSHAFPVAPTAKRRQIQIDKVPPDLHRAVISKCKRRGISLRSLVLTYLQDWSAQA